ncbi:MAG: hypothetical protein A2176_12525 [Spirochaetes bacterium RBG_13_51_14]|nr:MAG: hypothetical protein A2176_12525 [Spirochaetes bacterium RBG_13_51_14]
MFISVVLAIHGSVNFYIGLRGWQALPGNPYIRIPYLVIFITCALSYMAGRVLERVTICAASDLLIWIGSFWFGMMLYLFIGIVFCDLLRLANWIAGVVPVPSGRYDRVKSIAAVSVTAAACSAVFAGWLNAMNPRINTIAVDIPKRAGGRGSLDIALVTDLHLGTMIKNARLQKMVDMVNVIRPDLILLCGDIVDEDLEPVIKNNLGQLLCTLRSRYGVFAVTGNHEYIGGVDNACRYLSKHGVRMLRDEAVLIDNCFNLVGREDASISQFTSGRRKPLDAVMGNVDRRLPVIMMDHQPLRLSAAEKNGVDLQVSGHTHHGQLWPASIITNIIYEVSYGYRRSGSTNYYVSCGFGTWGPPSRLGTRPEVVHIQLRFGKQIAQ